MRATLLAMVVLAAATIGCVGADPDAHDVEAASSAVGEVELGLLPQNWGVVEEGKVFRSAHPRGAQFSYAADRYGLKSVLILTGSVPDELNRELDEAGKRDITTLFLPISDKEAPSDENLLQIVKFLADAPKPLLLHCRAGADRTGLVSAIHRHFFMGAPLADAKSDMLSWRWGHLSFGPTRAMDAYFVDVYPTKVEGLRQALSAR
jgi:hypothetical protein